MRNFTTLISRKWAFSTLLVLIAMGVMIRLGIWQLDRLTGRRAFNANYLQQSTAIPLDLNHLTEDAQLETMAYRPVVVTGHYDHSREMAIRNQSWDNQPGVHLLTPLIIAGSDRIVLVDRGWIPLDAYQTGNWQAFHEPGTVQVSGILRLSQSPTFGGRPDPTPVPGQWASAWNFVDLPLISRQFSPIPLPVYIQQAPDPNWTALPYRTQPTIELTEGPHLSYAIQWFAFTAILAIGYPLYLRREIAVT